MIPTSSSEDGSSISGDSASAFMSAMSSMSSNNDDSSSNNNNNGGVLALPLETAQLNNLTVSQEKWLSVLPIIPSILSVIGSSIIIYMIFLQRLQQRQKRQQRRQSSIMMWNTNSIASISNCERSSQQHRPRQLPNRSLTPYKRILIGMSVCDILISATYPFWSFGIPSVYPATDRHVRVWAVGNHTSCSTLGFLTQFAFSGIFYHGMLSFYFLLTARYGKSNDYIAKYYEPFLHIIPIGFALVTATVGVAIDLYHEVYIGIGCWIAEYPEGCNVNPDQPCIGSYFGWVYGGLPSFFSLFSIMINNFLIYSHVRTTVQRSAAGATSGEFGIGPTKAQTKRVQAVAVQASLYVGSFAATYSSTIILRILETVTYMNEQSLFPLLVMQALCLPTNGFFNVIVFVRPKYVRTRMEYPNETRVWAVRRAIFGDSVQEVAQRADQNDASSNSTSQMTSSVGGWPRQSRDNQAEEDDDDDSDSSSSVEDDGEIDEAEGGEKTTTIKHTTTTDGADILDQPRMKPRITAQQIRDATLAQQVKLKNLKAARRMEEVASATVAEDDC